MKNTTKQNKLHKRHSDNTRWAYFMQCIEPKSEAINTAFPDYHPQWVQLSQRLTIAPENFHHLRRSLGLSLKQCAAYLRVSGRTIAGWESGKSPVPFAEFELLRLILESPTFKISHTDWSGWFIDANGVLHSPDIGGKGFTPEQLVWLSMNRSEAALLRSDVARLQAELVQAGLENRQLRQMFLDNGVVDEVAAIQKKINGLMSRINTAHIYEFTPTPSTTKDQLYLEKVA